MTLWPLVRGGGVVASVVLIPAMAICLFVGHAEVARGLLLGLLTGLLNGLLLARKLDRTIEGDEPWQTLQRTMPRNMLMRFALILSVSALASRLHGINLLGLATGLAVTVVLGIVYAAWVVYTRWKKEDGIPVWAQAHSH